MFQHIDLETFRARTGICQDDFARLRAKGEKIVSLREIVEVNCVQAMPKGYLYRLIESVTLDGDPHEKPYSGCVIELVRMDPNSLLVGQTFVERGKLQRILEHFTDMWSEFCVTRGIAKRTAWIVSGTTALGESVIAHYLPPIVEDNNGHRLLLDGVHRNFLTKAVGTTIETVVIKGVRTAFPCTCSPWDDVRPVDEKPTKDERFQDLDPALFRNIKAIGIDG